MVNPGMILRGAALLGGLGLLAACQQGPGGSMAGSPPAVSTVPGSPGASGAGSPTSNAARARSQTPPVIDDNRGAPL